MRVLALSLCGLAILALIAGVGWLTAAAAISALLITPVLDAHERKPQP